MGKKKPKGGPSQSGSPSSDKASKTPEARAKGETSVKEGIRLNTTESSAPAGKESSTRTKDVFVDPFDAFEADDIGGADGLVRQRPAVTANEVLVVDSVRSLKQLGLVHI